MQTRSVTLDDARLASRGLGLSATLVGVAAAVGALAATKPAYSIVAVLAAAVGLLIAQDVRALPVFLAFTIFVESTSLGGETFRIGRLSAVLAVAVLAYYALSVRRIDLRPNALLAAALAYGLWLVASAYWASDVTLVWRTAGSYGLVVAYMLSFALLVRSREHVVAIFATFAVGSLAFGLVAVAVHVASGGSVRAEGLQGDPNFFALYQLVALPGALILATLERSPARRLGYYVAIASIVISVVFSQSRMGLVVLSAVILATLLLPRRFFFRSIGQRFSYAFALAAVGVLAALAAPTGFLERTQTLITAAQYSGDRGSGRLDLWRAAWQGFTEHKLFGLGAGNFRANALELLQSTPGVDTTRAYIDEGRFVHSIYLEPLVDLGVVGLILFGVVLVLTARYLLTARRRAGAAGDRILERLSVTVLVMFAATLIAGIFLSLQHGKLLWILIGLALALDVMAKHIAPTPTLAGASSIAGAGRRRGTRRR